MENKKLYTKLELAAANVIDWCASTQPYSSIIKQVMMESYMMNSERANGIQFLNGLGYAILS